MRRHAFTLLEMVIAVLLTAILFVYLYGTLDQTRKTHRRFRTALSGLHLSQRIQTLLIADLTQMRTLPSIVHEPGYDRIAFVSDHTLYGIPRPWIHYYISRKDRALIRIEATEPLDFGRSALREATFFADRLATGCRSLRFSLQSSRLDFMVRCQSIDPIVGTLYKGDR